MVLGALFEGGPVGCCGLVRGPRWLAPREGFDGRREGVDAGLEVVERGVQFEQVAVVGVREAVLDGGQVGQFAADAADEAGHGGEGEELLVVEFLRVHVSSVTFRG